MKNEKYHWKIVNAAAFRAVLFCSIAATGQTVAPAQQPAPASQPCTTAPAPPKKMSWYERRVRVQMCKVNKNFCDQPDDTELGLGKAKPPCPVPPAAPPTPTAPESKPIVSADGKHLYACPKGATKSADGPYCIGADHSPVPLIEIAVPAGLMSGPEIKGPDAIAKPGNAPQPSQPATPAASQSGSGSGAQHN
jgi:hypothetical protein